MGQSAAINGLPPLPPGATLNSADGLPPLPPGAKLNAPGGLPPRPQPAQDALAAELGTPITPGAAERTYDMHSPSGHVIPVRYSRMHQALDQGLLFADKQNLQSYARDHAADPLDEDRIDQWLDKHPYVAAPVNLGKGLGIGLAKTLTGLDRTPTTRAETEMQMLAATPPKGAMQETGEVGENMAEFFSGEELLEMLGKSGAVLSMADKLKTITGIAQLAEKVPMVGKLLKIGASAARQGTIASAARQGTIAGVQTLAKTGDIGAAGKAAGVAAVAGPVLDLLGAGGSAFKTAFKGPAEAEAAAVAARETAARETAAASERAAAESRAGYAEQAREAIRPHLEATNVARDVPQQEVTMNQPGGGPGAPTGRMAATATGKPAPAQINIDQVLNQTHDFTGGANHLTAINDDAYTQFNTATQGKFRLLNGEIAAAQDAARKGEEGAAALYKSKLAEMDTLMDSTEGEMTPEMKAAAKAGFRQSYLLRDFGNAWDRNLNGIPGASKASQAQRGINGKGLLTDLQRTIKLHGRPQIEAALGPGRLDALEEIAQQNITEKQRQAFNGGIKTVADELERLQKAAPKPAAQKMSPLGKRAVAMTLGGGAGFAVGHPYFGMMAGEATYETAHQVLNAIKTNPKIAQNFLFALQSGATAERFGPFIATMIQREMTDSGRKQQQGQGRPPEWQQQPGGFYQINPQQPVVPALEPQP